MALGDWKIVLACSRSSHFEYKPTNRGERRADKQSKRDCFTSGKTIRRKIKVKYIFSRQLSHNSGHQRLFQLELSETSLIEVKQGTN